LQTTAHLKTLGSLSGTHASAKLLSKVWGAWRAHVKWCRTMSVKAAAAMAHWQGYSLKARRDLKMLCLL
jgi:hypothetical protein